MDKAAALQALRAQFRSPLLSPVRQKHRTDPLLAAGGAAESEAVVAAFSATQTPGLHEVRPATYRDGPAAAGFLCALTAMAAESRPGAIVWITPSWRNLAQGGLDFGFPYGPGLRRFGLDPRAILLVAAKDDAEVLWAAEEAAQAGGVSAVVVHAAGAIHLTAARRLHLAAKAVFFGVLRPASADGLGPALSRWSVSGATGRNGASHALASQMWATPRWRVQLDRRRDGPPLATNIMEWDHAAHRLRLGAVLGLQELGRRAPAFRPGDAQAIQNVSDLKRRIA